MLDDNEVVRQTIRISPVTKKRLQLLLQTNKYITESELIRRALNIGLEVLEKEE